MRRSIVMTVLLALLLAACGVPTNNTTGSTQPSPGGAAAPQEGLPAAPGTNDPVERNNKYSEPPSMTIDQNATYTATIETTKGTMTAELYSQEAPMTVNNFVFLARDDFYDGVRFHRIMESFMVQTGDPTGTGTGGPGYRFEDEPVTRDYERGTLAMANAGPNTNGSQFFIVHQDSQLPPNYTIFGQVTEGLDVLDAIATTPVTSNPMGEPSVPTEDVRIVDITIDEQ